MDHTKSVTDANNLDVSDFLSRFTILENAASNLVGTVEAALVRHYRPIWNTTIDGFGNHDPGSGRYSQEKSDWDLLHPGRVWAERLAQSSKTIIEIVDSVEEYFKNYQP